MSLFVSVYVPCFNGELYIERCIRALLAQNRTINELLVIDDGSTDSSMSRIASLSDNITIIRHPKNLGLASARNTALAHARYEYIASVDADVAPEDRWLESLCDAMNTPHTALVGGKLLEWNQESSANMWRAKHMPQHSGEFPLRNPPTLAGANTLARRDILQSIGGYTTEYKTNYEDVDLQHRLTRLGLSCRYEPTARAWHLRHDTVRTVLRTWWAWLRPPSERAGSFASDDGLAARRKEILERFRICIENDMKTFRSDLAYIGLLGIFAFVAADFSYAAAHARSANDQLAQARWNHASATWFQAVERLCRECMPMGSMLQTHLHHDVLAIDWWTTITSKPFDARLLEKIGSIEVASVRASSDVVRWLNQLPRAWWPKFECGRMTVAAEEGWETISLANHASSTSLTQKKLWPTIWRTVPQTLVPMIPDVLAIIAAGREGTPAGEASFVVVTRQEHPKSSIIRWSQKLDETLGIQCRLDVIASDAVGWLSATPKTVTLHHNAICIWGDESVVRALPSWPPSAIPETEAFELLGQAERALDLGDPRKAKTLAVQSLLVSRRRFTPDATVDPDVAHPTLSSLGIDTDQAPASVVVARVRALIHDWLFTWEGDGPGVVAVTQWHELRVRAIRAVRGGDGRMARFGPARHDLGGTDDSDEYDGDEAGAR